MANEEYPIDEPMQGRRPGGGLVEYFLPEKVKELLKHVEVDPTTGKRTVTLPNFTITFDAPQE